MIYQSRRGCSEVTPRERGDFDKHQFVSVVNRKGATSQKNVGFQGGMPGRAKRMNTGPAEWASNIYRLIT